MDYEEENPEPEEFRALILGHPNSENVRWWKARLEPSYDRNTASANTAADKGKWAWEEQDTRGFRAIKQGTHNVKRYLQQGEFETSDITLTTMPDELPFDDHDWVCPIGRQSQGTRNVDAVTLRYKEPLTRGSVSIEQSGTLAVSGVAVTGTGTQFIQYLAPGSIIQAAHCDAMVLSVQDDTHLTLVNAPAKSWNGNNWKVGVERLKWDTTVRVETLTDGMTEFAPEVDFLVAADGQTLQWLTANAPAMGAGLSIVYRYLPKYVIMGDKGTRRHVVKGVPLPQTVVARLWQPEGFKSAG